MNTRTISPKAEPEAIKQICRQLIAESSAHVQQEEILNRASELVKKTYPLKSTHTQEALLDEVLFSLWGLGSIEFLFRDKRTNEIMINGPGRVWIEQAGELILTELSLDVAAIQTLIEKIISPLGLRVDRSNPQVDARLPDGSRVHIITAPLAVGGPYITIRRFVKRDFQIADFVSQQSGFEAGKVAEYLANSIKARLNIIISGGTSSGKTTLLSTLLKQIQGNQRIIVIEDTAELFLNVKNLVRLETRLASAEGIGEVTQRDLVKTAIRMRPDRIVVGEVRGAEALDMMQAMNTGNAGSLSTCHANSAKATLSRLETMMLMAGDGFRLEAVRAQINSAVDLIIHLNKNRKISGIAEISENGKFKLVEKI